MGRYILRRLAFAIPTILGISLLTFGMLQLVPGDPVRLLAGEDQTTENLENIRRQLGFDQPPPVRYLRFLAGLPFGNLGISYITGEPIADQIVRRYPRTLLLAVSASLFGLVFGIILGTIAGLRPGSRRDIGGMFIALLGISLPSFWLGLMLIFLFSVQLRWLPMLGLTSPLHLIIPTITLGTGSMALIARMTRASIIDVMSNEYIRTARAKGVAEPGVVLRHAMKNALMPVLTVAGIGFGFALSGSAIAEVIFSIDGIGRMMVEGIFNRDVALVQAAVMVLALNFVIITLLLDVLQAYLDPRLRGR